MQVYRLFLGNFQERLETLFREHGVAGEVRRVVRRSVDEVVFVIPWNASSRQEELVEALQRLLGRPVRVTSDVARWHAVSEPF